MKHTLIKKITAALCAAVTALTASAVLPVSAAKSSGPIVAVLGDSLGTKYNLAEGDYGYSDYIAEYLKASDYRLLAKNGATSAMLLEKLQSESADALAVKEADVILVTIGSNDMLSALTEFLRKNAKEGERFRDYFVRLAKSGEKAVLDAATKLTSALRTPRNTLEENMQNINRTIRELNPDAKVVYQKIYNPFETASAVYNGTDYSEQYEEFLNYVRGSIKRVNDQCFADLEGAVIADPYTLFRDNAWKYTFSDKEDIHPNAYGHAIIAADTLNRLGYTKAVVPQFAEIIRNGSRYFSASTKYIPLSIRKLLLPHSGLKVTHEFGDVDLDGSVTAFDATAALTYYTFFIVLTYDKDDPSVADCLLNEEQTLLADTDGDGEISAFDATLTLQYYTLKYLSGFDDLTWDEMIS